MESTWYKNAIIYALDIKSFRDSNADGIGDFRGLIEGLDYLKELGITCVWLLPFYPSPLRDNGYDVQDYCQVDPRLGSLDDFSEFIHRAGELGIRVIIDLVMNHTSDRHPWFLASRSDPRSRYRDYYIWSDLPPTPETHEQTVFPGEEKGLWAFDPKAQAYYFHQFYRFEPDLNSGHTEVQSEVLKVVDFWMSFGIAGFRIDALPLMLHKRATQTHHPANPFGLLKSIRSLVSSRSSEAILLGEVDVDAHEILEYFAGDELHLTMGFFMNAFISLALADENADRLMKALRNMPRLPAEGQWANFLRNLDELNLMHLSVDERNRVYNKFAPDSSMRLYDRGIRRRLAPMLGGDTDRLKMAFSLLCSLPGTPLIAYGDELGMGEDLNLPGREAVRCPFPWTEGRNGGFSSADAHQLFRPVIDNEDFSLKKINLQFQERDPSSLLNAVRRVIRFRRDHPEIGNGDYQVISSDRHEVAAHLCSWKERGLLAVHNLSGEKQCATLDLRLLGPVHLEKILGKGELMAHEKGLYEISLQRYGYLWLSVKR